MVNAVFNTIEKTRIRLEVSYGERKRQKKTTAKEKSTKQHQRKKKTEKGESRKEFLTFRCN